jgi:serine protease
VNGAQQVIVLTGTGQQQAAMTSPAPDSVLPGPSVTFKWSAASGGVNWYYLSLGSTGAGSRNIFNTGDRTVTSWTTGGIPTNGETIYARLTTNFNGVSLYFDYTYTAATQAALVSPAPGAVFAGPAVTFTWAAGTGATGYTLWLGSKGMGSNDISSRAEATTSDSFAGLPTNGETIYVRLFTSFNGTQVHADYTYTAATQAALTSPTSGAILAGPTVKFTSSSVPGATGFRLVLGSAGAGSSNLFDSGTMKTASVTAAGLPTSGETIYARLYTNFSGAQFYADYTFTAAKQAMLISPAAGYLPQSSALIFTWTQGTRATGYRILFGTAGAGSSNVYNSGVTKMRMATIRRSSCEGETIYARLFTDFNGVEVYADTVFKAQQERCSR